MDTHRFDALSKALAGRSSRRTALRRIGGGGLAAALVTISGRSAAAQDATPAGGVTSAGELPAGVCAIPFEATVRQGASAGQEYSGLLIVKVEDDGSLAGDLIPHGAAPISVVGQATGRAVNLMFTVADGQYVFGVGTAEQPLVGAECGGTMGGPFVGPQAGDAGDWLTCNCELNPSCYLCDNPPPEPEGCGIVSCQFECYATEGGEELYSCLNGCRRQPFCP